jgi:hypothetical protein
MQCRGRSPKANALCLVGRALFDSGRDQLRSIPRSLWLSDTAARARSIWLRLPRRKSDFLAVCSCSPMPCRAATPSADCFTTSTRISFAMHSGRLWQELSVRLQGLEATEAKSNEIIAVSKCLRRLAPKGTALAANALNERARLHRADPEPAGRIRAGAEWKARAYCIATWLRFSRKWTWGRSLPSSGECKELLP